MYSEMDDREAATTHDQEHSGYDGDDLAAFQKVIDTCNYSNSV